MMRLKRISKITLRKAYLSHEIGHRKPEAEAWSVILKEQGLEAWDVLFIDDSPQHIEAAKTMGNADNSPNCHR